LNPITLFMTVSFFAANTAVTPPVAKTVLKEITINGDRRVDNYFWLLNAFGMAE